MNDFTVVEGQPVSAMLLERIAELEKELAKAKQSYTDIFEGGVENCAELMIENAALLKQKREDEANLMNNVNVIRGYREENAELKKQVRTRGLRMEVLFQWVSPEYMEKAGQSIIFEIFRDWFTDDGIVKDDN
jgi:uncharacterized membrane protein YgaE (UPF0421/DUF939 family)